jgi:hypothetical protein
VKEEELFAHWLKASILVGAHPPSGDIRSAYGHAAMLWLDCRSGTA